MGTVAVNAAVESVLVPMVAHCLGCEGDWQCEDVPVACPACGSLDMDLGGGDELLLESIEYRG